MVGVGKEGLGCHAHAPASAHADTDRGDDPAERLLRQLHSQQERLLGVYAVQENQEFVSAEAPDQILPPKQGLQASGNFQEHRIPLSVAQGVIDGLEVIHIHDHQSPSGRASGAPLGAAEECPLVIEPGEAIVIGLIAKLTGMGAADARPRCQHNPEKFIHPIPPFCVREVYQHGRNLHGERGVGKMRNPPPSRGGLR